eukprot:Selendium_serpulae@DN137_c0_g1_i1.p1
MKALIIAAAVASLSTASGSRAALYSQNYLDLDDLNDFEDFEDLAAPPPVTTPAPGVALTHGFPDVNAALSAYFKTAGTGPGGGTGTGGGSGTGRGYGVASYGAAPWWVHGAALPWWPTGPEPLWVHPAVGAPPVALPVARPVATPVATQVARPVARPVATPVGAAVGAVG